jgi:hypothetical protein
MSAGKMKRVACLAVGLAALLVARAPALAAGGNDDAGPADARQPDAARDEEQALERAEARKLRKLREELEMRRKEAARKRAADEARYMEMSRLRATVMGHEQRESTLRHDLQSFHHQLGTLSRDPSDHSAIMRRSELERQLDYTQNQLDYASRSRENSARQLDALRFR